MLNRKVEIKYFIFPLVFILVILFFIFSRNAELFKANISEILGNQLVEGSSENYLLNESKNAATVLLYNQFEDRDFDGVLDQADEENNKFALVKFTKGEEIIFNGVSLRFEEVIEDSGEVKAKLLVDGNSEIQLKIDSSLILPKLSLVARDIYKSSETQQVIVFLRTN